VARFYDSYLYYKENKDRYEVLDVTGPDEYHERVNNNAFTNYLIRYSFLMFLKALEVAKITDRARYKDYMKKHDLKLFVSSIRRKAEKLYLPAPDTEGIIEQFDGYFRLEDITLSELSSRKLHPNEYLGGAGLASTTQIIKQADVVTMLCLFGNLFKPEVLRANFNYYEPRTEHGSSLSASMYSLLAIKNGEIPYAYDFFLRSASIDYTGHAKEYAGGIYIGGSHPASAGGAYMSVVYGFLGFEPKGEVFTLNPKLPESFSEVRLHLRYRNKLYFIIATREETRIIEEEDVYENKTDHI
jgi:trehalose/maltose hydrolase-like predicted phosphorylase